MLLELVEKGQSDKSVKGTDTKLSYTYGHKQPEQFGVGTCRSY